MSNATQVCPNCDAISAADARLCYRCGAALDPSAASNRTLVQPARRDYDFRYGETDLLESEAHGAARWACIGLLGITALAAVLIALAASRLDGSRSSSTIPQSPSPMPTRRAYATITGGPPTATFTMTNAPTDTPTLRPTPAPCLERVAAGDSLIGIIARCGHRSLNLLPTVKALNGIVDETRLQIGQEIIVPPPSPTLDPNRTAPPPAPEARHAGDGALALLSFDPFAPTPEPTLLPGLMWHRVRRDETMIAIALLYNTNAKLLSDLNPEVEFALCDFGLDSGGPECIVNLRENQRLRVPAPTSTPAPAFSGSETPTPLPSATVNAPHAYSPIDQTIFTARDQITLRWVSRGRLAPDEVFQIAVTEQDSGETLSAETRDLFFILPPHWQAPDDQLRVYRWQVTILNTADGSQSPATQEREFSWHGAAGDR